MKNDKGKNIIITLLIIVVVVLMVIIALMYMGVITNSVNGKNNNLDDNEMDQNNSTTVNEKKLDEAEALIIGKDLYDMATEIYGTWIVLPYCGLNYQEVLNQRSYKLGDSAIGNGNFYKTDFKDLDGLKDYLSNWLSDEIISEKITETAVTDLELLNDSEYGYTKYVIKDDNLYCGMDTGKGWVTTYLNHYDMSVNNIEDSKVSYKVNSYYLNDYEAECSSINTCDESDISTKETNFVIKKEQDDIWVVSEFILHE